MKIDGYNIINEVPLIEDTKIFLRENKEEIKSENYDKMFYNLYNSYGMNAFVEPQILSLFKNEFNIRPNRYSMQPFYYVTIKRDKLNRLKNETYYIKNINYANNNFISNFSSDPYVI